MEETRYFLFAEAFLKCQSSRVCPLAVSVHYAWSYETSDFLHFVGSKNSVDTDRVRNMSKTDASQRPILNQLERKQYQC